MRTPNAKEMEHAVDRLAVLMRDYDNLFGGDVIDDLSDKWREMSSSLSGKNVFIARAVWRMAFDRAASTRA